MVSTRFSRGAVASVLASLPFTQAYLYDQVVSTAYGDVQGYQALDDSVASYLPNWESVTVFKGIPFAATTGGANRFRAPQPASPWNGTLDAADFGNICPVSTSSGRDGYTVDEDCLSLNIWTPANSTTEKLPVVMWSYPAESTALDALFDGAGMADKGIVFVNFNYRTGAFGWFATPELSEERYAEVGHNSSGNYGMLDQQAALKWIHANIASFGGDPDHITVQGQSAGSASTYHLVNSPLTKGLIVGAIIESGVRYPADPLALSAAENYDNQTDTISNSEAFMASLNCTDIACMRALPMADVTTSFMGEWSFSTTLDGYSMAETYYSQLVNGPANDVPILTGNTKDETGATYGLNITLATYLDDNNATYGAEWAEKFEEVYAANDSATASAAYNAQYTDRSKIGTWLWSQLWFTGATSDVYNYYWDHAPPGQSQGAYHESEINYVLNNLYGTADPWTSDDYTIASTINAYWVNFIKTGNPNGGNLTQFDKFSADDKSVFRVGDGFNKMRVGSEEQIELLTSWFATLPYY